MTSDRLPIGLSYAENHYYPAIAIQKFHGMDSSGKPLPPTRQETTAFIRTLQHASQMVSALSGSPQMNIVDMIEIILYNADAWNERERILRDPFA